MFLLGGHGLYVYANPFFMGVDEGKLFLAIDVHVEQISTVIRWVSINAMQSFIVPATLIVIGLSIAILNFIFRVRSDRNAKS